MFAVGATKGESPPPKKPKMIQKKPASSGSACAAGTAGDRLEAGKGIKFNQLKREGRLPSYIVDLYNDAGTCGNRRRAQTAIVNKLLVKNPLTGCWTLCLDDPTFREPTPNRGATGTNPKRTFFY